MTTPDALVAEALAELDSLCLFVGLAPGDPTYREPIMRAFEALVADRAHQAILRTIALHKMGAELDMMERNRNAERRSNYELRTDIERLEADRAQQADALPCPRCEGHERGFRAAEANLRNESRLHQLALARIAALEAQIDGMHMGMTMAQEDAWKRVHADRAQQAERVAALEADNALLELGHQLQRDESERKQAVLEVWAERIAALEAALTPFAHCHEWLVALAEIGDIDPPDDHTIIAHFSGGGGSSSLRWTDLVKARAALAATRPTP